MKLTTAEQVEQNATSLTPRVAPLGVWRSEGPWLWGPVANSVVRDSARGTVSARERSLGERVEDERSLVPIFKEGLLG